MGEQHTAVEPGALRRRLIDLIHGVIHDIESDFRDQTDEELAEEAADNIIAALNSTPAQSGGE